MTWSSLMHPSDLSTSSQPQLGCPCPDLPCDLFCDVSTRLSCPVRFTYSLTPYRLWPHCPQPPGSPEEAAKPRAQSGGSRTPGLITFCAQHLPPSSEAGLAGKLLSQQLQHLLKKGDAQVHSEGEEGVAEVRRGRPREGGAVRQVLF